MQYKPLNYVQGMNPSLQNSLQQLSLSLGQELQQRRDKMQNAYGLQQAFPEMSNEKATGLGMLNPNILQSYVKEELRKPMYQGFQNMYNQNYANDGSSINGQPQQTLAENVNQQISSPGSTMPISSQQSAQPMSTNQVSTQRSVPRATAPMTPEMFKQAAEFQENRIKNEREDRKEERKERKPWSKRIDEINKQLETIGTDEQFEAEVGAYLESGQPLTGLTFTALQKLGLEKGGTNLSTQAVNKAIYLRNLNQLSNLKGMGRMTDRLQHLEANANPSLENTPEGLAAIREKNAIVKDTIKEVALLKKKEYDRIGQDPLGFKHPDPDYFINDQIRAIEQKGLKRIRSAALKNAGYSSQSDMVEKAPDPTTFKTKDNGELYIINGKVMGSDGTKYREAKYDEDQEGNPIKFLGFKGE